MKRTIALLSASAMLLTIVIAAHAGETGKTITITEAIEIALKYVPGKAVKAEEEGDLYEIKIKTKDGKREKVYVDSISGEVVERKSISLDEAVAVALKEVPGEVVKVEFERDKYEVKIRASKDGKRYEVYIDSENGKIKKIKKD